MALTPDEVAAKAQTLQRTGARLAHLGQVIGWVEHCTRPEANQDYTCLNLSWNLGRAIVGYGAVEAEVTRRVAALLPNLLRDIQLDAQREVTQLLKDIRK